MNDKRRESKRFVSGPKSAAPESKPGKKGFAGLDPTQLGLDGPDWLAASPTTPPMPACSPLEVPSLPEPDDHCTPAVPMETQALLEGMKVVCICKGIKKSVFWKALDNGVQTKEDMNRVTGSGSGGCKGRRCGPRILEMLRGQST